MNQQTGRGDGLVGKALAMPLIPAPRKQRQADLCVRGQSGVQSKFQDSQDNTEKNKTKDPNTQTKRLPELLSIWVSQPACDPVVRWEAETTEVNNERTSGKQGAHIPHNN